MCIYVWGVVDGVVVILSLSSKTDVVYMQCSQGRLFFTQFVVFKLFPYSQCTYIILSYKIDKREFRSDLLTFFGSLDVVQYLHSTLAI